MARSWESPGGPVETRTSDARDVPTGTPAPMRPRLREPPPRALAISLFALLAAVVVAFLRPDQDGPYLGFVWLLALIPPFLLAYYRGWTGAAFALVAGMVALTGTEVIGREILDGSINWWVFGVVTVGLLAVSAGAGVVSELLHRSGGDPSGIDAAERWRRELRRAIETGELRLHYQPIVSFDDGKVHGVEALVRWEHPTRGLMSPDQFLTLAESAGLMVPLGNWVLEEALGRYLPWRERFGPHPGFFLSVNLDASQCRQAGLRQKLRDLLRANHMEPEDLQVEVTEQALTTAAAQLDALKRLGVRIAVDDFGKGFVSLSQLSHLPIDALKVDGMFVRGMEEDEGDRALVESILKLAGTLGLQVTAEGVETQEQFERLRDLGCAYGQGYYFAEPYPVGTLEIRAPSGA